MFCPQCGTSQSEELKFCKACGVNLQAVRQAAVTGEPGEKFDWSKTWVAEMFVSGQEAQRRKAEVERLQGITPEYKRYNEIKGGVITASVGVALMIFLFVFMEGIVAGGKVAPDEAEILSRVWVAGVIPLFVGLGLIFNGTFVSRKQIEAANREQRGTPDALGAMDSRHALRAADTSEFIPADFSVVEGTTRHLGGSAKKPQDARNP
ncbi:MAG TPA: hypothetical protein VK421_13780 [Pyrinomonadaceae bacterium]|nr:hypothetical protein [Pyrinomonadaceae bacterium]